MPVDETNPEAKEKEEARRAKREKERVAAWKASQEEKGLDKGKKKRDEEEAKADEAAKVFMMPKEKRKVAFIKKEVRTLLLQ
jgi:nucleolar protein 12